MSTAPKSLSGRPVWVRCEIYRSAFSGERVFQVVSYDRSVAPVDHFTKPDGTRLGEEPGPAGVVSGRIVGKFLIRTPEGLARVILADGEIYEIPDNQIVFPRDEMAELRDENRRLRTELAAVLRHNVRECDGGYCMVGVWAKLAPYATREEAEKAYINFALHRAE